MFNRIKKQQRLPKPGGELWEKLNKMFVLPQSVGLV